MSVSMGSDTLLLATSGLSLAKPDLSMFAVQLGTVVAMVSDTRCYFLKTHSVVLMVTHNAQQLAYHDLD